MDKIERISQNLMIIMGILMYIFGTIGNILNISIFFRWSRSIKTSKNNSSLYLLISSLSNLIIIIYPLLTRIIFDGFQYSVTKNNVFILCKFRYYILHTFDLISLICICLATFDRYLITSRKVRLRNLSPKKKQTKQIIVLIIILCGFHSIPIVFYFNVSNEGHCIIISEKYLYYYLWIFQIILHSFIPIIFLSIFGILTYRHLNQISTTKSITRMLLLMSISIVLSSIPYCIKHIYYVIITKNRLNNLYHVITTILFYTNPVTSFYIFYISTPNFRLQVQNFLFCKRRRN
jgi:hypothetical protein